MSVRRRVNIRRKIENWRVLDAWRNNKVRFSEWKNVRQFACIRYLSAVEKARLRILVAVLLAQKKFIGVQGLKLTTEMRLIIAAQACVPILKLGINYYSGFTQVSIYPSAFWVERDEQDATGVVHHVKRLLSGESWSHGPVIISWDDVQKDSLHDHSGHNVIIHEFVHKIDMLNQSANGVPPISSTMSANEWQAVFSKAYKVLNERIQHHHKPCINTYAGTSPAEFFAVASEYFFTAPEELTLHCDEVYNELALFYQQNPLLQRASR